MLTERYQVIQVNDESSEGGTKRDFLKGGLTHQTFRVITPSKR